MFEPKDFSTNQLFKIDSDIEHYPQSFFNYNNGLHCLFIKRLRTGQFAVCGLGTNITPIERQSDCDIYYKLDDLVSAKLVFEKTISLLITPPVEVLQEELF